MIQNAAARLVSMSPKEPMLQPLFISLALAYQWQLASSSDTDACIQNDQQASAPSYFHSLLRIYIPSRSLRSASERRLVVPSQRGSKSLSRTFSFTIPGWWNNLPTPIRNAGSLSIFFFFVINNFYFLFFHTQHNRISKIKQNKTADTYSTSQGSIKREGEREGQQEHKSHSFK